MELCGPVFQTLEVDGVDGEVQIGFHVLGVHEDTFEWDLVLLVFFNNCVILRKICVASGSCMPA